MPAKLGLPVVFAACVLLFAAPALAADTASTTPAPATAPDASETSESLESPSTTVATNPVTTAPDTTTPATTTTTTLPVAGDLTTSALDAGALGPVEAALPPSRGTQTQINPPPPPPPTIPWYFQVPANSGSGRRVVYSKSQQSLWAFDENNTLIKQHRVSGKQTPYDPAPGIYRVYSRSRYTYAINNPSIKWGYMVRFAKGANGGNIGFHEIPFQHGRMVQSEAQLGQALSGGCVRQAVSDAVWMWNWAGVGTVVVVTP